MKMRNYMKKKEELGNTLDMYADDLQEKFVKKNRIVLRKRTKVILALCCITPLFCVSLGFNKQGLIPAEEISDSSLSLVSAPLAATSVKKDLISIPSGTVKANPFLPYRDIGDTSVSDVPPFDIVEPPEVITEGSEAARVMDTIVSGILYDKYSPSAILNIEGNDYLVKKGDTVNNYKVLNIMQDGVTVKLGDNVYKAGIGEILTEGSVTHNDVSNLSNKFGGKK